MGFKEDATTAAQAATYCFVARTGIRTHACAPSMNPGHSSRSEEHTSELQSLRHLVCRLLLEKNQKGARVRRPCREGSRPRARGGGAARRAHPEPVPRRLARPALRAAGQERWLFFFFNRAAPPHSLPPSPPPPLPK